MLSCKMPRGERELEGKTGEHLSTRDALRRLYSNKKYREGVVAQFFYVGLQITCWTFIIQYGTGIFTREGLTEKRPEILSQKYNIVAMVLFCASRFVCTFLLKYIHPSKLLMSLATSGGILMLGVIGFESRIGMSLPGRGFRLHVLDVPDDLRYSPWRIGGRGEIRFRRFNHGHSRGIAFTPVTSVNY